MTWTITALLVLHLVARNPVATPGAVRPLSLATVCQTRWSLDVRHVTPAMRRAVYVAYGIPVAERPRYVIDHLIPRELGGADVVANLWPQTKIASRVKDRLENTLHRQVCTPGSTLTLDVAQRVIRAWVD